MGSSLLGSLKQASPQVKQKSAKVVGWKMVSSGGVPESQDYYL